MRDTSHIASHAPRGRLQHAVNLTAMLELTRDPTGLPLLMLLRGIVTDQIVNPYPDKFTTAALLVRDDTPLERWQAIVQLIRKRYPYNQFPLYKKGPRGWRAIRN